MYLYIYIYYFFSSLVCTDQNLKKAYFLAGFFRLLGVPVTLSVDAVGL